MKRQLIAFALAAAVAAPSAFAVTEAQLKAVKKNLSAVPVPELPAKAAELVTQAAKEDREAVAVTAVRTAIRKSRTSATAVVAAVSKAAPEVAGPVSQVAAEMEASQSGSISAAAVGAAPSAKTQITSSVHQGLYGASYTSGSASSVSPTSASSASSFTASSFSSPTLTAHGSASTVYGGHVETHHETPINGKFGGEGNGRFPTHPPFTIPPGHDPDHDGRPSFVDYTKPRHF